MLEILMRHFIPCFLNIIVAIYISSFFLNQKLNFCKLRTYVVIFVLIMLAIFNYVFVDSFIRLIVITAAIFIANYLLFENQKVNTLIIASLFEQLIAIFSELLLAVVFTFFFNLNGKFVMDSDVENILANIIIVCIMLIISKMKIIKKFYNYLIVATNKLNFQFLVSIILILFISINVIVFSIYSVLAYDIIFLINIFFLIIYIIIFCIYIKSKNLNIKFIEENKMLLSSLNEYEKMLDFQRVNNHENKNQLLIIKSMIEKKDNKLIEYINEIIKEKREDNEIIYNKAKRIPSGGLQGLIYQKMLLMQEKNIEVNLDINSKVRKINSSCISSKMNYDICRIVGIIIDNAIEETIKFNKKDREIIISMYVDDMFIIEVSNRIKDDVDLSKIYDRGYTSKEKGHGYGLSLLKKIVGENENIINELKIVNNIFTQVVKIKM